MPRHRQAHLAETDQADMLDRPFLTIINYGRCRGPDARGCLRRLFRRAILLPFMNPCDCYRFLLSADFFCTFEQLFLNAGYIIYQGREFFTR